MRITLIFFLICLYINNSFSQNNSASKIVCLNDLGYNIINYHVNERFIAQSRPFHISKPIDVLILGSSRIRKINTSFFEEKSVINSGVSGAILQDLLAIYYNYQKNNIIPKEIIIGIDPWLLNNNDNRWKVLKGDYDNMNKILKSETVEDSISDHPINKLRTFYPNSLFMYSKFDSINLEESYSYLMSDLKIEKPKKNELRFINRIIKQPYFYDTLSNNTEIELNETGKNLVLETKEYRNRSYLSLKKYQKVNIKKLNLNILVSLYSFPEIKIDEFIITQKATNDLATILYDGSIVYDKNFETYNEQTIKVSVRNFRKSPYILEENQKINQSNKLLLEKFITYLLDKDIQVSFVLVPFHPEAYAYLLNKREYAFVSEFETYVKTFAKSKDIQVIGSYNPKNCNIDKKDFYDSMHVRTSGLDKIILNE